MFQNMRGTSVRGTSVRDFCSIGTRDDPKKDLQVHVLDPGAGLEWVWSGRGSDRVRVRVGRPPFGDVRGSWLSNILT